ncbi:protein MICROTUBULE BINDING PROTEIN 2C isoform X2 [Neltuma alba]|uniref:protein MICROTUBULE BINDING PROTEIN 2C isoform X2 n=1 Tax=Neltuma alba TaxID=207710 RepID=UPI0010A58AFA|nr:protein MICROTUBULE BINDING PROTEIN 2C isoform X2 [Prosopis alba]XP_028780908.1 protein MICROTUBULE BINDING PROTEIN 2C-like isoform X2 [Prosopis alba]
MYEGQHFMDLEENSNFGDPNSWLSADDNSSFTQRQAQFSLANSSTASGANGSLDRVLFNDLVEIVPLVQSLIDRKASSSFTRRGSMVYTKTPSRETLSKRTADSKGRNTSQSIPARKKKDHGEKEQSKNDSNNLDTDSLPTFSSRALTSEKEREELVMLKEQVEDLQRKLLEKDEHLKSADNSRIQLTDLKTKIDELMRQSSEKDSLLKSTQHQLSDAKIKLADKQAVLEKTQWEATTSNKKVEMLREEIDSMQGDISSFMLLLEGLTKYDAAEYTDDYDFKPYEFSHVPSIDDLDEMEMQKMEEARKAYITALAVAKEKQDEESLAAASNARAVITSVSGLGLLLP